MLVSHGCAHHSAHPLALLPGDVVALRPVEAPAAEAPVSGWGYAAATLVATRLPCSLCPHMPRALLALRRGWVLLAALRRRRSPGAARLRGRSLFRRGRLLPHAPAATRGQQRWHDSHNMRHDRESAAYWPVDLWTFGTSGANSGEVALSQCIEGRSRKWARCGRGGRPYLGPNGPRRARNSTKIDAAGII